MTYTEICLLASQVAKGGPGMVRIAGQWLTVVLDELVRVRDLKMNRVTLPMTVTAASLYGPFPLEADYLRTYDLFYPIPNNSGGGTGSPSGIPQFLTPVTMEQWDAEFKDPSVANYPYEFATDVSTQAQVWSGGSQGSGSLTSAGQLFIYPASSGSITLTHRYMKSQPVVLNPEASPLIPWFPHSMYLITATAAHMMGITGDDRKSAYETDAARILAPYLIMEGDEQQTVHRVKLDPKHFRFPKALKPVKSYPY